VVVRKAQDWADRYRARIDSWRLPASKTKQEQLAHAYGADGYALCAAVYAPFSPSWLRALAATALNLIRLDAWWNGHPLDR
jgi:hypothetical protein